MTALTWSPRWKSSLKSFSRRGRRTSVLFTSRTIGPALEAPEDARHDLAQAGGELAVDLFLLRVADFLENDLFGGLGGDPAERVGGKIDLQVVAQGGAGA